MKKLLFIALLIVASFTTITAQEHKSRFGIEASITPLEFDAFLRRCPFSIGFFAGVNYEHFFSNPFSLKTTIGINNVLYKNGYDWFPEKPETKWQTMIKLTIEPRLYCWDTPQKWGNLFLSAPISLATGPFQNNVWGSIFKSYDLKMLAAVGYQYYFNSHFYTEANAGLGWSHWFNPLYDDNDFDYLLSVRFGYTF